MRGGASAPENELLRRATDLLLRKERGVGISAPPAPARQKGRPARSQPQPRPAGEGRKAAEAVSDLLNVLDRRRGRFLPGEQQRLVTQLEDTARRAEPWLTGRQRKKITDWKNRTPTPPAPRKGTAPTPSRPPSAAFPAPVPKVKRKPKRAHHEDALPTWPRELDLIADAARDVLEHAARLGKTISFTLLCTQVKGLRELSQEQQRRALDVASARSHSRQPLTVLITTGSKTPHPHYQQPGNGPAAQAAWTKAVADVHASFEPRTPPPGAQPDGQHSTGR